MLDDKIKQEVKGILANMAEPVILKLFTQSMECGYCKDTHELMNDLVTTSDKLSVQVFDFEKDAEQVKQYNIENIPAIVVMDAKKDYGIRFYGIPAGYEFSSLLNAILMVSTGINKLTSDTKAFLDYNKQPIHLKIFVTPTCPYCPLAVMLADQLAQYSDNVTAEMIELSEFPHLAVKYGIQGVPRTVINDKAYQDGAAPELILLEKIKSAL